MTSTTSKHPSDCAKCAICPCRCCRNKRTRHLSLKNTIIQSTMQQNPHSQRSFLILVRHGISEDEVSKRYTGWNDCGLSDLGKQQMHQTGQALHHEKFSVDVCFTSVLKRAIQSLFIIQEEIDHLWVPVYNMWRLNDRMLGNLSGFHQDRAQALFGQNQIKQWLIQPHLAPPPLEPSNILHPRLNYKYRYIKSIVPSTETLIDVRKRLLPFISDRLFHYLHLGQNILLVTHQDIIKALIRLLNNYTVDAFNEHQIPIGVPIIFEFSLDTNEFFNSYYLSSPLLPNDINDQSSLFPIGFNNEKLNTKKQPTLVNKSIVPERKPDPHFEPHLPQPILPSTITSHVPDSKKSLSHNDSSDQPGFAILSTTDIALYELATPNQPNQNENMIIEDNTEAFTENNIE